MNLKKKFPLFAFLLSFLYFPVFSYFNFSQYQNFSTKFHYILACNIVVLIFLYYLFVFLSSKVFKKTSHRIIRFIFSALFFLNLVDITLITVLGRYLNHELISLYSFDDFNNQFGWTLIQYSFSFISFLFSFALPCVLLWVTPYNFNMQGRITNPSAMPSKRANRILTLAIGPLCLLLALNVMRNISHSEKLLTYPRFHYNFFNKGILSLLEFRKSPNLQKENEELPAIIAKLYQSEQESFVYPSKKYPLFKMGVYEKCLFDFGIHKYCTEKHGFIPPKKKNIVFISLESFRSIEFDGLSKRANGLTSSLKEVMDQHAVWFPLAFSVASPTSRSLGSTLCSYPGSAKPLPQIIYPYVNIVCLPDILHSLNYRSLRLSAGTRNYQNIGGFYVHHNIDEALGYFELTNDYGFPKDSWNHEIVDDRLIFDFAKNWIKDRRQETKPFFLAIETMASHAPWNEEKLKLVPDSYNSEEDRKNINRFAYRKMVKFSSDITAQFLKWMISFEDGKFLDDSIIVVMSDHGPYFHEPEIEHLYPKVVKEHWVPLFIIDKDAPFKGPINDMIASNLDLAPTLLGLINSHAPNAFVGRDLFALKKYRDKKNSAEKNSFIVWNYDAYVEGMNLFTANPYKGSFFMNLQPFMDISVFKKSNEITQNKENLKKIYEHILYHGEEKRNYVPKNFQLSYLENNRWQQYQ